MQIICFSSLVNCELFEGKDYVLLVFKNVYHVAWPYIYMMPNKFLLTDLIPVQEIKIL